VQRSPTRHDQDQDQRGRPRPGQRDHPGGQVSQPEQQCPNAVAWLLNARGLQAKAMDAYTANKMTSARTVTEASQRLIPDHGQMPRVIRTCHDLSMTVLSPLPGARVAAPGQL
jgi:hypothetical protein